MDPWGSAAMEHWRRHLPRRYRALEDPQAFFTGLGAQAAARYEQIRDSLLEGVNPNDGTIGWAEFQDRVAQADQTAREMVEAELIYLPPEEETDSPS
jgi:hypothetical protein